MFLGDSSVGGDFGMVDIITSAKFGDYRLKGV